MMRSLLVCAAVVVALAGCGTDAQEADGTDAVSQGLLSGTPQRAPQQPPQGESTRIPELPEPSERPTIDVGLLGYNVGSEEAPVRVVEMSDFGCSFCKKFHEDSWPTLLTEFVETGKVQWKFMPFINGMFRNSLAATEAAECTLEQSSAYFERYSDRLWTDQEEWKAAASPEPLLRQWAVAMQGLDAGQYDECIATKRRTERIAAATALARELGVRGTPTFFVVGYPPLQGALPTEAFQQVLNAVHAQATGAGG